MGVARRDGHPQDGPVGMARAGSRRRSIPPGAAAGRLWLPLALLVARCAAGAVVFHDTYYSPRNSERPLRKETRYIILHTTEAPSRSAGVKLAQRGEAHYLIDEAGRIYRIIDQRRVACHCGRSMWNGRTSLDNCSLGIEVAGYHNREHTEAQYRALRSLLAELQRIYRLPDARVLTHSMVAYGAPNQWQPRSHRGRKRCGMRFAISSVRARIGLTDKPARDPDVVAGRLAVADPYLHRVLYSSSPREQALAAAGYAAAENNVISRGRSAWDIARDAYNSADTIYVFPDGSRKTGREITNWRAIPGGTRVLMAGGDTNPPETIRVVGRDGNSPLALAGAEALGASTIYILPGGACRRGDTMSAESLAKLPEGTQVLVGYKVGGPVTARCPAFNICGPAWQASDTYFLCPGGKLIAGDQVDAARIPRGTMVLFKN